MSETIHQVVPAESGWRAFYRGEYEEDAESARIVAWALMDGDDGSRALVGLVVDGDDPTRIIPAPEGGSAVATELERYGFRED